MIQLTPQQVEAVAQAGHHPATLIDPTTQATYVLVPQHIYERLVREEYDDSPWTSEERHALAWEAGKHAGWEQMHEYDDEEPGT